MYVKTIVKSAQICDPTQSCMSTVEIVGLGLQTAEEFVCAPTYFIHSDLAEVVREKGRHCAYSLMHGLPWLITFDLRMLHLPYYIKNIIDRHQTACIITGM